MKRGWDIAGALCILCFAVGVYALQGTGRPNVNQAELLTDPSSEVQVGEEWIGLYFKDEKVGLTRIEKRAREGGGYHFDLDTRMHLKAMGRPMSMRTIARAQLGPELDLQRFTFELDAAAAKVSGTGVVNGKTVELSVNVGGVTRKQSVALTQRPLLQHNLGPMLARADLKPGARYERMVFDPLTQQEQRFTIEVVGPSTLLVMDREIAVTELKQTLGGLEMRAWMNARGEMLRQELPLGLVALRETEEEARWGLAQARNGDNASDLMLESMVSVAGLPDRITDAKGLSVKLEGEGLSRFKLNSASGRQRFADGVFTITKQRVGAGVALNPPGAPPESLKAEPLVEVDHPKIQGKAERLVRSGDDTVQAARRIANWVNKELRQTLVPGAPSALQTLETREGDCNEHSVLFAAIARAAGVPTRVVIGLVYREGRFGYHAWNEILTADGWLAIDVTWDQFPADVGHLRFIAEGLGKQIDLLGVVGKLKASQARLID